MAGSDFERVVDCTGFRKLDQPKTSAQGQIVFLSKIRISFYNILENRFYKKGLINKKNIFFLLNI